MVKTNTAFLKSISKNFHETEYGILCLIDNMEALKAFPSKSFDFLITDPPYGIKEDGKKNHSRGAVTGFAGSKRQAKVESRKYTEKNWDSGIPDWEFFFHCKRVSEHQVYFGGNYYLSVMVPDSSKIPYNYFEQEFLSEPEDENGNVRFPIPALGKTNCFIVWDKKNEGNDFADCELAWTSFETAVRKIEHRWNGMLQENMKKRQDRFHPTEKPIEMYMKLLEMYVKPGQYCLDTNAGSSSFGVACIEKKVNYVLLEVDEEYFNKGAERLEFFRHGYSSQLTTKVSKGVAPQGGLF